MSEYITKRKKYWFPVILGLLFLALFIFVSIRFIFQSRKVNDQLIAEHISQLDDIFKKINNSCKIAGFEHQKNHIDFLNVTEFSSSTVGPVNLYHPEKWEGPYLNQNLTIESKEYQIVRTKKGYYILPGDGVALSNGIIIGKNLIITPEIDIEALWHDPNFLLSNGKPLAAKIETASDFFAKPNDLLIAEHIQKLSDIFKRINEHCTITGFRSEKDYIDFLTVKKFAGSIVGSMNLANPQNWQGPYLDQNLSFSGKLYQIIKTKKGYYIIPGDGVVLSNGQIIGQTLIIISKSDIDTLMQDPAYLLSNGKPLAARIETVQNPLEKLLKKGEFFNEPEE